MSREGYYRFPAINKDVVLFISEDDLWRVPLDGGSAIRLTSNLGPVTYPHISPDGKFVAFIGRDAGAPEVFVMPSAGGSAKRLTFLGGFRILVIGWTKDGKDIVFSTSAGHSNPRMMKIYKVSMRGGQPELLPVGHATHISFGPGKRSVLGRNTADPARWKRYRGGTAGHLWIDTKGSGKFIPYLKNLNTNLTCPMWIGKRIYFISDHEGIGNIYSATLDGKRIKRHTDHKEYYTRNAATDGKNIVYHSGGNIYIYNIAKKTTKKIPIIYNSPKVQLQRKFVSPAQYLQDCSISHDGKQVAINCRGRVFNSKLWIGPVFENGESRSSRYRLPTWLKDGKRLLLVTDETGEERLEIHYSDNSKSRTRLPAWNIGRIMELQVSPAADIAALVNHRYELILVDLVKNNFKVLDKSKNMSLGGLAWSPDGRWLAYHIPFTSRRVGIKHVNIKTKKSTKITNPVLVDTMPEFSEDGKYLYFISASVFNPVYDHVQFELGFMNAERLCLIPLQTTTKAPFEYNPELFKKDDELEMLLMKKKGKKKSIKPIKIDLSGITERVISFPIPAGRFGRIKSAGNKVFYTVYKPEGALGDDFLSEDFSAKGVLKFWNFVQQKEETFASEITDFDISAKRKKIIYLSGRKLRILSTEKSLSDKPAPSPKPWISGWYDFNRLKLEINPIEEWKQMYSEAWRLQRENFWTSDMSNIDWKKIYKRYYKLIGRLGTRGEFSDLMWEMQGELGTSHAYEFGGDYKHGPHYAQGYLGANYIWNPKKKGYKIVNIVKGDSRENGRTSPLLLPGNNVKEGDHLLSINGIKLTKQIYPEKLLVNKANSVISLKIKRKSNKTDVVTLKTLNSEIPARYRAWVEENKRYVHKATKGKVGYVHIPDMGPNGFSEFHRYFLAELEKDALIVDVRYNGGGHVSQLIVEKLARKIVGYDIARWHEPESYPGEAVKGPIVAITNEHAGSDGDIFSHVFKLMKIGPLVGKRTWGGVIGIWPRHLLIDNTITTQPEFAFWFKDVGWGVENYGTDPDYDIDIKPQDYVANIDPQMEKALELIKEQLKKTKFLKPNLKTKSNLSLPKL